MVYYTLVVVYFFFFQAEDGIRDVAVTGVQTCALPICDVGLKRAIESSSPKMQRAQISALREGALASAGLLVGIVPWGIVAGVAMVSAGLTQPQAVAMSFLGLARTTHPPLLSLPIPKTSLWVMIATALRV